MGTIYRQWLILRMIPRKGRISTTGIRDRLSSEHGVDITLRTVQRDLISLEAGFPLECDGQRPAGWSWRKDAPLLDVPNMDPVTALTFSLAERYVAKMLPPGALSALEPYFRTAEANLERKELSRLCTWPDKVRVVSRNLPIIYPVISSEISWTVYTALLEERRFTARYRNAAGDVKEYEVSPLGLAFVEGLTYLVAELDKYRDPVLLVLHRMLEARLLEKRVVVPDGFDLDEYVSRELSFPVGKDIRLKVAFTEESDVKRLLETPIAADQAVRQKRDDRFELTATVADTIQLRWWLRGYGARVEVLYPKGLRSDFILLAREMAEKYRL